VRAISHLNFHQQIEPYFQHELDDDKGVYHAMHYNAVLLYKDKSHPTFVHYQLPYSTIANPANDQVQITRHPIVETVDDGINISTPPVYGIGCCGVRLSYLDLGTFLL
jgi:hypothetical protein